MNVSMLGALLLSLAPVQDQEVLQEKLDAKLAEEWVAQAGWISDYDKARETAKKSGKPIFTYFTRSYAY